MEEKNLQYYINKYNETNKILRAYGYANYLSNWDAETTAAFGTIQSRNDVVGSLSELSYKLSTSAEYTETIDYLFDHRDELDDILKHEIYEMKKNNEAQKKIPMEDFVAFSQLLNEVYPVYVKAKNEDNYDLFAPYLEKIIEFKKKQIKYLEKDNRFNNYKGYDLLLDGFEPDMTREEYDKFFGVLKEKLVPFIKKVTKKKLKYNKKFLNKKYASSIQFEYAKYLQAVMEFDPNYTVMRESEHPFTTGFGNKDVRITNHYYEDNVRSSIFSAIHEMGHGLYELHVSDEVDASLSGGGASMAMHESQSRFMENMIARKEVFWETHFSKLQEMFPKELKGINYHDFFLSVNEVKRDFIRTEADELTYPLHIMVRYELEKKIFSGKIKVSDLSNEWNKLYKKYLGLKVTNNKQGILQDVHWAYGNFGYFPTYALGSAYAAQFYKALEKDVDIDKAIRSGKLTDINNWLKEHIHKYGASLYPKEIIKKATGEDFNPDYYVKYLIDKYSKIYEIDD
ncbi:MAG: carboxypeptidase M32 [Bacilli bacterium]|nr:carboxypeptidase M32 [Bacilli bacterium]